MAKEIEEKIYRFLAQLNRCLYHCLRASWWVGAGIFLGLLAVFSWMQILGVLVTVSASLGISAAGAWAYRQADEKIKIKLAQIEFAGTQAGNESAGRESEDELQKNAPN